MPGKQQSILNKNLILPEKINFLKVNPNITRINDIRIHNFKTSSLITEVKKGIENNIITPIPFLIFSSFSIVIIIYFLTKKIFYNAYFKLKIK